MPDRIVAAEMGSKNAVIVCEDARFDLAVTAGILSAFKTTGQRCVSASRILVHEIADGPLRRRRSSTRRSGCSSATRSTPNNFTGPVIHQDAVEKVLSYNALAKKEGAKVLLDGGEMTRRRHAKGCFLSPFVYRMEYEPGRARRSARRSSARTSR